MFNKIDISFFKDLLNAIGARDFNQDLKGGDWRWARRGFNSRLSYFAFGTSEPDGSKTNPELCLGLDPNKNYEFVDIPCSTPFQYICVNPRYTKY